MPSQGTEHSCWGLWGTWRSGPDLVRHIAQVASKQTLAPATIRVRYRDDEEAAAGDAQSATEVTGAALKGFRELLIDAGDDALRVRITFVRTRADVLIGNRVPCARQRPRWRGAGGHVIRPVPRARRSTDGQGAGSGDRAGPATRGHARRASRTSAARRPGTGVGGGLRWLSEPRPRARDPRLATVERPSADRGRGGGRALRGRAPSARHQGRLGDQGQDAGSRRDGDAGARRGRRRGRRDPRPRRPGLPVRISRGRNRPERDAH